MNNTYKYKYEKYKEKYLNLKRIINNQEGGHLTKELLNKMYSKDLDKFQDLIKSIRELLPKDATYLTRLNEYANGPVNINIYHILIMLLAMIKKFKKDQPDMIALLTDRYMNTIDTISEPKQYNTEQYCSRYIEIILLLRKGTSLKELLQFPFSLMEIITAKLPRITDTVNGGNIKLIIEFLSNDTVKKIQSLREKIEDTVLLELINNSLSPNKSVELNKAILELVLSLLEEILKENPRMIFNNSITLLGTFTNLTGDMKYYENYKDILKRTLKGENIEYNKEVKLSKYSMNIAQQRKKDQDKQSKRYDKLAELNRHLERLRNNSSSSGMQLDLKDAAIKTTILDISELEAEIEKNNNMGPELVNFLKATKFIDY